MRRAQKLLKAGSLWALLAIIMTLAPAGASAQPCCDFIVDVAPDVKCCVDIVQSLWSDGVHPGGTYCPTFGPVTTPVPCPVDLIAVTIQTEHGPRLIEAGVMNVPVRISEDCCILISVLRNAPCNIVKITSAPC